MAEPAFSINFGADTTGLSRGTERAKAEVVDFTGEFAELRKTIQDTSYAMTQQLYQALQKTEDGFEDADQKADKFNNRLKETDRQGGFLNNTVKGLVVSLAALFTVDTARRFADGFAETAVRLDQVSQRLGIGREEIAQWGVVAQRARIDLADFEGEASQIIERIEDSKRGNQEYADSFRELGIDINVARTNSELLLDVAQAFSTMPEGPRKTAIAVKLLGGEGGKLLPIFNEGREAIVQTMEDAAESGEAASEEFIAQGLAVDSALNELNGATAALSKTLAVELGPTIIAIIEFFTRMIEGLTGTREGSDNAGEGLRTFTQIVKVLATALATLITAVQQIWAVLQAFGDAVAGLFIGIAEAVRKVAEGDFAGAADAFGRRMRITMQLMQEDLEAAAQSQENLNQLYADLWASSDARDGESLNVPGSDTDTTTTTTPYRPEFNEEVVKYQLEQLRTKQAAEQDNFDQWMALQNERIRIALEYYGRESVEYEQAIAEKVAMEQQWADQQVEVARDSARQRQQIAQTQAAAEIAIQQTKLDSELSMIDRAEARGLITAQQAVARRAEVLQEQQAMELEAANRIYQIHVQAFQDQLALENLKPRERERILRELEVLEAEHLATLQTMRAEHDAQTIEMEGQTADAVYNKWLSITDPIAASLSSTFQQLYNGQITWRDAVLNTLDQILFQFVDMGIQMAANWAANQLAMTAATVTGASTRAAAEEASSLRSIIATSGAALANIANSAAQAAAGAFAAIARIPYVGPFLAPAAAAAALVGVLSFGANVVSARGGLDRVAADGQMAELHKDEMVLPANIASPLREAIAGWTVAGSSANSVNAAVGAGSMITSNSNTSDTKLVYSPTISNASGSLDAMLKRDAGAMRKWLREEVRKGRLSL